MKKTGILAVVCLSITVTSVVTAHKNQEQANSNFLTAKVNQTETKARVNNNEAEPRTYKTKLGNDKNNQVQIEVYRSKV
ncbi:MAG: hypothetical protein M3142_15765, partial [Bacteroidota bacterium]|nr:hypothetical protein [Bacteroidota bacterium]